MTTHNVSHRQRIETCLSGERPDRVPFALWRHFPVDDQTPDGLAAACSHFQTTYDFDLMKVTPSSSFCLTDWGVKDEWTGNPEGTRDYVDRVVRKADEWAQLRILDPKRGKLADQVKCLRMLTSEFGPTLPIIQTIFSPMSQAKNLVGPHELPIYVRRFPDQLEAGLKMITATTLRFIDECRQTGIAGIFFAVQHAQYGILSDAEFERFEKPYDLQILNATRDLWLNLLHLHGEELMFSHTLDYPAQIINWHDRQTAPTLSEAQKLYQGVTCGGLRQWETMVLGTPEAVKAEAMDAIEQTGGRRFILGTGCVLPITAPHGNVMAAKRVILDSAIA